MEFTSQVAQQFSTLSSSSRHTPVEKNMVPTSARMGGAGASGAAADMRGAVRERGFGRSRMR